jgi:deazaflavin-dependent oxidoreductase (nitroreductase family)
MRDFSLFGAEHVRQYEATAGKVGHDWNDTQVLILHTTGRKSGMTRKLPLIYGRSGEDYLVVASNGGASTHPAWYLNLEANPEATIQVWGDLATVTARTASAEDKARLWPLMTAQWPEYDKYQAQTERDIPLVILTPRR